MTLNNENVFISGGNGVIGKELVKLLYEMGANIFVGDLKPRPLDWPKEIKYRQGDLNFITEEEILSFEPSYFFHLAATFERSTETYDFWYENHQHNSELGSHLMTIFKDSPTLKKVINCSSYLIYDPELYYFDHPVEQPKRLVEGDPIYPRNLTGVAKLYHEIELRFLDDYRREQFKSVSARIYRSYGKNSRDVISRWIRDLLVDKPITVYRKEGIFDFIYAGDVAKGLAKMAVNDSCEGVINLGTGNAQRVSEILRVLKLHFPSMKMVENEIDIPYEGSEADVTKLERLTGWKPELRLEDAIPLMIQHEKEFGYEDELHLPESNILISSISAKIPLLEAVKTAASKFGPHVNVFGADGNPNCLGSYFLENRFWQMPLINDLDKETLIEYCKTNNITAILPTRDGELLFWASLKSALADDGITVLISDTAAVELCYDKLLFYSDQRTSGFPIIPTSTSIDEIDADYYVIKERFGAGAEAIGIRLTKDEAIVHAKKLSDPIFQPYVDGVEVSVDVYVSMSGKVKGLITRTRDLVVNGESQITTTFEDPELTKLCVDFAERLGICGHAVLQLFIDDKGAHHIIECNCRFGGASTLSIAAGLDSFYWGLLEANNVNIEIYSFFKNDKPLRQIRSKNDTIKTW